VSVSSVRPGDTPRLSGEDAAHARTLAQVEGPLPPIVVHRATMQVIDGMHRLQAARLRGEPEIAVRFFDGDEDAAFVLGVECNMAHGLPLTLPDRVAAAAKIVVANPLWSDRAVAEATGLAAVTVAGIRERSTGHCERLHERMGKDGRVRPLNTAHGRRLAGALIVENPDASLREIARQAGLSPATVQDVRERLKRGEDPVPPRVRNAERSPRRRRTADLGPVPPATHGGRGARGLPGSILDNLRSDPSVRYNESGRALLGWLARYAGGIEQWREVLYPVPPHCAAVLAELARGCAAEWSSLAKQLERQDSGGTVRQARSSIMDSPGGWSKAKTADKS